MVTQAQGPAGLQPGNLPNRLAVPPSLALRFHVDVIALVYYVEVRVRCFQAAVIFVHAHAGGRHAVTGKRFARGIATCVEAVRNAAHSRIAGRVTVG